MSIASLVTPISSKLSARCMQLCVCNVLVAMLVMPDHMRGAARTLGLFHMQGLGMSHRGRLQ